MKAHATRILVAAVAGLAVIADAFLLFVKPHQQTATASQPTTTTSGSGSAQSNADSSGSADASTVGALQDGTYTSVASPNAYGKIQLEVKVEGGKITSITTLQAPSEGRSQSINAQALPELTSRAISAQSADIQFISGATETSTAFVNSLQDAINQSINAGQ
ncbi:FMN-binding protein [Bifidobacterium leontopitheci]|uniref:FMN-binding domain-containing protein n=1 Tax=Bifidobacterium leontopitheci TaxID=2650774 RepID=A0A6I1GGU2_9BIFI|nr:FMN-binding protein [Bifidobacterium leontopitheci]KAB7789932.1 FMN-binding domain-containing protein [Bifidobacterium leontopitheci]